MHLSLLPDSFVSDSLKDSAPARFTSECGFGAEDHLKGLCRGMLFAAVLSIPLGMTALSAWLVDRGAEASYAPASRPAIHPDWVAGDD